MHNRLAGSVAVWAALVLGMAAQANEKPSPEYQQAMKDLNVASASVRNSIKSLDYATIEKDAAKIKLALAPVLAYWQGKKIEEPIKITEDAIKGAADLEAAAKAGNYDAVVAGQLAVIGGQIGGQVGLGSCAACHVKYRTKLPDGTFEIK